MEDVKLFGLYPSTGIEVKDPGLREYITLKPVYAPRTFGRHEHQRFYKSRIHIVERLINKLMTPGHRGKKHLRTSEFCTGKSSTCTSIVKKAFKIISEKTNKNPVEVFVKAVENSTPRDEVTVIEMGGTRIPKQVDTAPQRRVDLALRWMTQGSFQAVMNKKTPIEVGLANEIIAASENDVKSFAISKSSEMERQAAASK